VTGDYQSKLTLMSESLRNDGRVWVPKAKGDKRARQIRFPTPNVTTIWNAVIRRIGNLAPRDVSSRAAKERCDAGPWCG
jgi:succinate dehydrogenase / fumarate reductase flavoprotein subunit